MLLELGLPRFRVARRGFGEFGRSAVRGFPRRQLFLIRLSFTDPRRFLTLSDGSARFTLIPPPVVKIGARYFSASLRRFPEKRMIHGLWGMLYTAISHYWPVFRHLTPYRL